MFWATAFGGLAGSFYKAYELKSHEATVESTLNAGLQDCRFVDARMPDEVVIWLRDYHNRLNCGSAYSFLEILNDISTIEDAWHLHRTKPKLSSRSCSGEDI